MQSCSTLLDGIYGHEAEGRPAALRRWRRRVRHRVRGVELARPAVLAAHPPPVRSPPLCVRARQALRRPCAVIRASAHRDLITSHWSDVQRVTDAMGARTVVPSLILKKLSAYRQQNSLAAALREIGRIERTLLTLRWFKDPALRLRHRRAQQGRGAQQPGAGGRVPQTGPVPRPRPGEPAASLVRAHPRHRGDHPVQLPLSRLRRRRASAPRHAPAPSLLSPCRRWAGIASISPATMSGPTGSRSMAKGSCRCCKPPTHDRYAATVNRCLNNVQGPKARAPPTPQADRVHGGVTRRALASPGAVAPMTRPPEKLATNRAAMCREPLGSQSDEFWLGTLRPSSKIR